MNLSAPRRLAVVAASLLLVAGLAACDAADPLNAADQSGGTAA
jgi:hypothetical protein